MRHSFYFRLTLLFSCLLVFGTACQTTSPSTASGSGVTRSEVTYEPSGMRDTSASRSAASDRADAASGRDGQVILQTDQLRVEKELVQPGNVGSNVIYRLVVRAEKDIKNVRITDTLPDGIDYVSARPSADRSGRDLRWSFASMQRGQRETIEVTVRPTREGQQTICTVVTVDNPFCLNLFAGQARLEVVKTGPEQVELGDEARWTVEVTNIGSAPATNVVISDELPSAFEPTSPMRQQLGTIQPGASREVTFSARAVRQGEFRNRARANYDGAPEGADARGPDGNPIHESSTPVRVVQSGIRLTHTGPEEAFVFKPEPYRIRVQNTGDTDLRNVRITNQLPRGAIVSNPGGGRVSGDAIGWMIPNLPSGADFEIVTEIAASQTGPAASTARLVTPSGLEASDSATTNWKAVPGVTISITDSIDPIQVGGETVYTIVIRNQGDFEPVGGTIEIEFTDQIRPIAVGGDATGRIDGQRVIFPRTSLEPGRDINLTVTGEGARIGPGRAILRFSSDFIEEPIISQEATNVF